MGLDSSKMEASILTFVGVIAIIGLTLGALNQDGTTSLFEETQLSPGEFGEITIFEILRDDEYGSLVEESVVDTNIRVQDGWIVELNSPSVVEQKIKLDETSGSTREMLDIHRDKIKLEQNEFKNKLRDISTNGNSIGEVQNVLNAVFLDRRFSKEEILQIEMLLEVKKVSPNYIAKTTLSESIPLLGIDNIWKLNALGDRCIPSTISTSPIIQERNTREANPGSLTPGGEIPNEGGCLTGEGIVIGVIDTGVDYTHSDLGGCIGENCKVVGGWDFINDDSDPIDDHGHGTHVASTIAGEYLASDGTVLNGAAFNSDIVAYKVLNAQGTGNGNHIISAIDRSVDPNQDGDLSDHLDIISLSLGVFCGVNNYDGFCGPLDPISLSLDNAVSHGVIGVVAAGNDGAFGESTIGSPGTAKKAITIGATHKENADMVQFPGCTDMNVVVDDIACFSSIGPTSVSLKPDLVAPGVNICAAQFDNWLDPLHCVDNQHIAISGTSMATPLVSGIIALLKQKNYDLSPKEIKDILKFTSVDTDIPMSIQGYGRVNPMEALGIDNIPIGEIHTLGEYHHPNDIEITGYVNNEYSLYYTENTNAHPDLSDWIQICQGDGVSDQILCNFDVSNEGEYFIRLVTTNHLGIEAYDESIVSRKFSEITDPDSDELIPTWFNEFDVIGTAAGSPLMDHYELEFCKGGTCFPERVTINDPNSDVVDGILATISVDGLTGGFYTISLKLFKEDGSILSFKNRQVYIEDQMQIGWPIDFSIPGPFPLSFVDQPTISDLDGDGTKEVIFAYEYIRIYSHNGTLLQSWYVDEPCNVQAGPSIDDLDNDGNMEIVVSDSCGRIHVFNNDGSYFNNNWPKDYGSLVLGTTISDIDNDGQKDIIYGDWLGFGNIYALDQNGNLLPGWPFQKVENYQQILISEPPAIANLDGDEFLEIVVTDNVGDIYVLNHDGSLVDDSAWPMHLGSDGRPGKLITDLDQDGENEIIAYLDGNIHVLNIDGTQDPGWPRFYPDFSFGRDYLSVGDIDIDGELDILFSGEDSASLEHLGAIDSSGNMKDGFPISQFSANPRVFPSIGQLDTDSQKEITIPRLLGNQFFAYNHDGSIVDGFPKTTEFAFPSVRGSLISDLDGDGDNELLGGIFGGRYYVWDIQASGGDEDWNEFDNNPQHTSYFEFVSLPECQDGYDNDNDGFTDLNDVGCSNEADDDETNCGDGICEGGEEFLSCSIDCVSEICTADDLESMRSNLDSSFKQICNIDLSGILFEPFGSFSGTFDGNGYRVSNLSTNTLGRSGLFSEVILGGSIMNVTLIDVNINGENGVGGLVGELSDGSVTNSCVIGGTVSGDGEVGGLVGLASFSTSIQNSCSTAIVNADFGEVGGLVGTTEFGSVIINSYSTGDVNGGFDVGGFIGENEADIVNSYSAGFVNGDSFVGGLVGDFDDGTITNSYWDIDTSGQVTSDGGIGLSTVQMQMQSTFEPAWDFETIWDINEGQSYPFLRWQGNPV